jgi:hypothetical protein
MKTRTFRDKTKAEQWIDRMEEGGATLVDLTWENMLWSATMRIPYAS